jgi:uncharacterized protein (DUF2147 family)
MKRIILFCSAILLSAAISWSQIAPADKIVGVYLTAKKTSQVRIFKATDGKYYGKIAWMEKDKEKKDSLNPDLKLRTQKVFGLMLLKGLKYNAESKQWEGGTVYDPDNGKTYDCFLWFDPANPKVLKLKGYVLGMRFIGRESEWILEDKIRE